jgi:hypothetical protein
MIANVAEIIVKMPARAFTAVPMEKPAAGWAGPAAPAGTAPLRAVPVVAAGTTARREKPAAAPAAATRINSAAMGHAVIRSGLQRHILQSPSLVLLYVIKLGATE